MGGSLSLHNQSLGVGSMAGLRPGDEELFRENAFHGAVPGLMDAPELHRPTQLTVNEMVCVHCPLWVVALASHGY